MKPSQRLIINAVTISFIVLLGFGLGPLGGGETKAAQRLQKSSLHLSQTATAKKTTKRVVIPNLVGKTKTAAESVLKTIGLKIGNIHYTTGGKAKPGTVVTQSPAARVKASKGSRVDIWILMKKAVRKPETSKKSHLALSPNLHKKGQRLFLEFPAEVRNVEIYSARGRVIQRFKCGRRFDITQSLKKIRTGRIRVGFVPKSGGIPKPPPPTQDRRIYADYRLDRYRDLADASMFLTDSSTIEDGEPANNTIHGATTVTAGRYSGEVGATDADDYLKLTTGAGLATGDRVLIYIYDPANQLIASNEGGPHPINVTTNNRSVLEVDLREMYWPVWPDPRMTFPPGDWRMLVTNQTAGPGSPVPYGTGDAPRCYTQRTGYWLRGTRIP
jgi:hypothetical protein